MVNIIGNLSLVPQWQAAFNGRGTTTDWDAIFGGSQATVDWPGSFFWRELIDAYPDAKVLLSVRSPESWARSMQKTIWGVFYDDVLMRHLSDARANIDPGWADYMQLMKDMWQKSGLLGEMTDVFDPAILAAAFDRYNDEVRATVPAGRLLEWKPPTAGSRCASSSRFRCRRRRCRTSMTPSFSPSASSTGRWLP